MSSPGIAVVIDQHADEAVALRHVRSTLVRAPHVRLLQLTRLDERLAAHLDGLAVAGAQGTAVARRRLDPPTAGSMFAVVVNALEQADAGGVRNMLELGRLDETTRRGVLSAFGWVSATRLRGITKALLDSDDPWCREVGLASCAMHRVNPPEATLRAALAQTDDATLAARAAHVACQLGLNSLRDDCAELLHADAAPSRWAAARAGVLLGDRDRSIQTLDGFATHEGECRDAALAFVLKLGGPADVASRLKALSADAASTRALIRAIGVAGSPHHVAWLIERMGELPLARLAGESFSLITGLDLAYLDLDCKPPEGVDFGPDDDPANTNVALDEDESLPWPDPAKIAAWWQTNGARFATGQRYFMGQPPSVAHCSEVLRTGFQRQRRHAAEYLCLLQPGTPLFNVAAPAWRQQRLLS